MHFRLTKKIQEYEIAKKRDTNNGACMQQWGNGVIHKLLQIKERHVEKLLQIEERHVNTLSNK